MGRGHIERNGDNGCGERLVIHVFTCNCRIWLAMTIFHIQFFYSHAAFQHTGINSFKFFMAYKGSFMINDELLLQGLKRCKSLGALAMVHAENGDAVDEGQKRMIELGVTGPEGHALSRPPEVIM